MRYRGLMKRFIWPQSYSRFCDQPLDFQSRCWYFCRELLFGNPTRDLVG